MKTESEIRELLDLFKRDLVPAGTPDSVRMIGCTYAVGVLEEILGDPSSISQDFARLLRHMRARRDTTLRN